MSFRTQALLTEDYALHRRIAACASREGIADPMRWTQNRTWIFSAQPGWDAAYEYALATGNSSPGATDSVISDGMILAAVQAIHSSKASDSNPSGIEA